ncbi:acyl carrier protein [Nocardia sp. NPDC005998]
MRRRYGGLDSISAMDLRNIINEATGIRPSIAAVFEHRDLADLVA